MKKLALGTPNGPTDWEYVYNALKEIEQASFRAEDNDDALLEANNLGDVDNAVTAFGNIKQAATETVTGVVELATTAEATTGSDTVRAVTPAGVAAAIATKANLASPMFTGAPLAPTAAADTNTTQIATTAFVLGQAASQGDQETGSSTTKIVTSGRQKFHPSAAKAWAKYTEITTTTLLAGYNVSSLTDAGTGDTVVNFTVAFSSVDYSCVAISGDPGVTLGFTNIRSQATGSVDLGSYNTSSTISDFSNCTMACFGDQ